MNLPQTVPSLTDPRWPDWSAPLLAFLRSRWGGAMWEMLTAWAKSEGIKLADVSHLLAYLECAHKAYSVGFRGSDYERPCGGRWVAPRIVEARQQAIQRWKARTDV
jgi:hypothetical protein